MPKRNDNDTWQDPHAAREADRYENPIPSREAILEVLEKSGKPLTGEQIASHFKLFDEDRAEALRRRLGAMVRDGQAESNRRGGYTPLQEENLIRGRVTGHPDGFGFLIPEDGSADLLLTSREMRRIFHGDIILARVAGYDHKGRPEGQLVRVIERGQHTLVGRYFTEDGQAYVVSDNKRITQEILIVGGDLQPSDGQFVTVEIVEYPTHRSSATGRVTEILGEYLAPGMEIDVAIRNFDIPHVWPEAVEKEAARIDPQVAEADKEGRVDLRALPLVTIDGEDARDFDDAVFCEKRRGGFRLIVAIADVSHYVKAGSALDLEAINRGNSVYFPQQVVPMLPEVLSNGLCSLNPHVDRLCMVCDMTISLAGRVTGHKFYEGVMHSKARLTYNKVSDLLERPDSEEAKKVAQEHAVAVEPVQRLYELFKVLRANREKRGALDFDSNETRIIFSKDRKIEKIVPVVRNQAHMLIEECMLAANVCAAEFVASHELPALYRNHEGPRDEKLAKLRTFLGALGISFTAGKKPQPSDFQAVLAKVQGRPDTHVIQTMLLRSLSQAVYAPANLGHFGLAYEAYAHFTSPIRRYPDLLLHRVIRARLRTEHNFMQAMGDKIRRMRGNTAADAGMPDMGKMVAFGEHCSMTERRADEATRDVMAWLKCEYMSDRVGEEFDGVISSVTSFGIFVELTDIYVDGLVHISNLKSDYYEFDASMQKLVGSRSGTQFALGDSVRIRVAAVNLDERKMDFDLVSGGSTHRRAGGGEHESRGKKGGDGGRGGRGGGGGGSKAGTRPVREQLRDGDIPGKGGKGGAGGKAGGGRSGGGGGGGRSGGGRSGGAGGDKPSSSRRKKS
ncbi:MAG: putative ribonuclease [Moraxellaceae bacterium]|jgi:ribonuclease R|nr:putative ribonuclease [Moraxellaceae bacterium]